MSVVMSFIFMGFGLAICGAAATIYYKQERELKVYQPAATYLVAAQEAKKAPVSETPKQVNHVKQAEPVKVKKKRKSLYKALLGTKKRRPSGDKIYRQRISRLAGYMQRNLDRGVDFYTLQEQMRAAGWREREILRAYYKIKK